MRTQCHIATRRSESHFNLKDIFCADLFLDLNRDFETIALNCFAKSFLNYNNRVKNI